MDSLFEDVTPRSDQALPLNTTLNGEYTVGRVLRQSGNGFTYLAKDPNDRLVVVQELFPKHLVSRNLGETEVRPMTTQAVFDLSGGIEMMLREGDALQQVNHPSVAKIQETFASNSTAYVVSAYYEGRTLSDLIMKHGGRLAERMALENALLALTGLKAIHDRKVVHKGIKPEQIYMPAAGKMILVNDGLYDPVLPHPYASTGYDAPELFHKGMEQGPWTDLYSFGGILYTALTGQQPAPASERIPVDNLTPPRSLNPEISEALEMVIIKLLSPEPKDRFASVGEFAKVLQPIYKAVIQGQIPPKPTFLGASNPVVLLPFPQTKPSGTADTQAAIPAFREDWKSTGRQPLPAMNAPITPPIQTAPQIPAFTEPPPSDWDEPPVPTSQNNWEKPASGAWNTPSSAPPNTPTEWQASKSTSGLTSEDLGGRLFPMDTVEAKPIPDAVPKVATPPQKKKNIWPVFLILLLGIGGVTAGGWWYLNHNNKTQVVLGTNPVTGAKLNIRSVETGETFSTQSPASLMLAPGKYQVSAFKDGFEDLNWLLVVAQGQGSTPQKVALNMTPILPNEVSIQVNSIPTGASITLDGTDTGKITPTQLTVSARSHTLIYTLNGYDALTREFDAQTTTVLTDSLVKTKKATVVIPAAPKSTNPGVVNKPTIPPKSNTTSRLKPSTSNTPKPVAPSVQQSKPVQQKPTASPTPVPSPATPAPQPTQTEQPKPKKTVLERLRDRIKGNKEGNQPPNN